MQTFTPSSGLLDIGRSFMLLKALRFKTPDEAVEQLWKAKPDIFIVQPHHPTRGLNT